MVNIGLNRRIRKFNEDRRLEAFGMRDMEVDQMFDDLAREGRSNKIY